LAFEPPETQRVPHEVGDVADPNFFEGVIRRDSGPYLIMERLVGAGVFSGKDRRRTQEVADVRDRIYAGLNDLSSA